MQRDKPESWEINESLRERIKEMRCLIAISQFYQQKNLTANLFLEKCVQMLPSAWHYPELTCAKITYQEKTFLSPNFQTTPWYLKSTLRFNSSSVGSIEIYLLQNVGFLPEEETLIHTLSSFISHFLESAKIKDDLLVSLNNYQEIFNSTYEALFIHDAVTGKIIDVNDSMMRIYGYHNKADVLNLSIEDVSLNQPPFTTKEIQFNLQQVHRHGVHVFEWLAKKANGDVFWAEISLKLTNINGNDRILAVIRDIEERKQQEQKIRSLTRLYATLSKINQCIITYKDQDSLYTSICDVTVEIGQFPLVWIGLIHPDSKYVDARFSAGKSKDYLTNLKISILDEPLGRGPSGTAVREQRLVICEDIINDPRMLPWRSNAVKYGYKSSATVPIKQGGKVVAILNFYAEEAKFFTQEEQGLLQEISNNLSFALDAIQIAQEHDRIQKKLAENEARLRLALKAANQGLYDLNVQTGEAIVSSEYARMLGYDTDNFQETNAKWIERLHPDDREAVSRNYQAYINGEIPYYRVEFRQRTATGKWKWILSLGKIVEWDEDGKPLRMLGTHTDIHEKKEAELQIQQLAFYDPLTSLPNRRLLFDRIENALALAKRNRIYGALLFIDLDRFKNLNNVCGHDSGDRLLQTVAQNLQSCLRKADTVGRFGGDEFIVLLPQLSEDEKTALGLSLKIAQKIREELYLSFIMEGQEFMVSASIGVTIFPKGEQNLKDILKEADTAMYKAKSAGRNTVCLFETKMQLEIESRFALESEIRHALENQEFQVFLQPQVDANSQLIAAEALIRWQNPHRGLIPPLQFIPFAEETGLITGIGEWILEEVCTYLAKLQQYDSTLRLSVNVSPYQFRQEDFIDRVNYIIKKTKVDPHFLTMEVTEGLILENTAQTIATMSQLKYIGIQFSIDDFGTGYSSLAYLKRLPIDEIKIDKSFVQDATHDENDATLIDAIIAVAQHFDLTIVGEGVESNAQAEFLKQRGCHLYQGYLYSKPIPMTEFTQKFNLIQ